MSTARFAQTATLLDDGTILVTGGRDNSSTYLNSAEIYNSTNNTWTSAGSFTGARNYHTATKLSDGRVLVVGGVNGAALNTTAIYTPGSGWSAGPNLNLARTYHSANLLSNGRVLVVGGYGASSYLSSGEIYNPTTNAWTLLSSNLLEGRGYHNGISLSDGRVLLINGWNLHAINNVDVFSIFTPITLAISGGTAPYTTEINGSAAAFTLPSSSNKIILYPSTSGTTGVYVEDSNTDRSNEVTFTVSP